MSVRGEDVTVEWLPVASLLPYDNNAKRHTREQLDAVKASIREFGFRNPIIVWHDEDGRPVIVAGHARAKAAQELGMDDVPCITCDDLDDAKRRALTLVDNQTTMMTGWDEDLLSYELDTLSDVLDMGGFGFEAAVAEDGFGTDFSLPDSDSARGHSVSLLMDDAQFQVFTEAMEAVGKVKGGGNDAANRTCEVVRQWMASRA